MLPLPTAQEGEVVIIKKITGNDATRLHLAEMGFTVGSKITVVTRLGGNMILQVRDSRVALDGSMARRIMY
jgi:ferrous iron transport protein A